MLLKTDAKNNIGHNRSGIYYLPVIVMLSKNEEIASFL